jgi:hypothetical protein
MAATSMAVASGEGVHPAHNISMCVPNLLRCHPSHGPTLGQLEHSRCSVQPAWMSFRVQRLVSPGAGAGDGAREAVITAVGGIGVVVGVGALDRAAAASSRRARFPSGIGGPIDINVSSNAAAAPTSDGPLLM